MMPKTILCHCEDVDVEELFCAVRQGYGDLETLKRYTGIGTGKCQGKCCFVQTLRILARLEAQRGAGAAEDQRGNVRIPTLRPPVLPMRIDDIVEAEEDEP